MASIPATTLATAANQLALAGRYDDARGLIAASTAADQLEELILAVTAAQVAVDQDFAQRTPHAPEALDRLDALRAVNSDPEADWEAGMARLRMEYGSALFGSDSAGEAGPEGRDSAVVAADLAVRAVNLRTSAPDAAREGLAAFYAGVIADNLNSDPGQAFEAYTDALALGERSGNDLLISLALRHLGDHARTAGDLALARIHWERSTELRQRVGHLLGALAQQALLVVLIRDEGNPAGASALATEVNRWSRQVPFPFVTAQTTDLLAT